ncbi:choline-sulfatase [Vibrio mangrovi]|uniref:Choline-sulfatase n=1 Tax=Vibrio mangrovi TaxID=474394 RepID=A0A1Y6ISJ0_9VIBR|nr:choline-sulfatase [Vibrio mangrovi]MDW6001351.1 choline-sulfatase [Vibrio mangrovi]SMS00627.1 Choline-sulfatase [Vibrio mangrovi]
MAIQQPNILFIMADQMTVNALAVYGNHKAAKTPNLDKIAEDGVVFDSAYCNSPLCAPSRYVLMTGQLPSIIGAYDNAADFPADIPTFAHYLRNQNYQTALSGKMHFCGPDQLHGFEKRLTTDIYPADYGWFPNWDDPATRPTWYHNMSSVTQAGPCIRSNQLDFDDEVVFHARRYLYDYVRGQQSRPFCLTVSMTHPHDPYAIPQSYWDRYQDEDIGLPQIRISKEEQDPHSLRLQDVYAYYDQEITDQQIRNARRAYYGAISYVDDQIGALLKTLDETGLRENTIIVFSGDHGDMLGERNLWYKMSYFEGSVRVPMIINYPGQFSPKRVKQSVSTMDLLPTFAELAAGGQPQAYAMPIQGRSLLPHLEGKPEAHDEVIGEYFGEGALAPMYMIRRGPYKYIHCPLDPDQLFDLQNDPQELINLADDANHAEILAQFRQETAQRWDSEKLTQDVLTSQRRRRLIVAALNQGERVVWDHQPIFNSGEMYMRNHIDLDDLEARARFPKV